MKDRYDISEEVICGFNVSSNRKKLWVCELDLLEIMDKICKENGIHYFLLFGSAIGALRHKGFIPWDDDIDMGMLREDFDKFLKLDKSLFPDYVDIQYGYTGQRLDMLVRIRDARTTGIINGEQNLPGNKGAFIEIQPYDFVEDGNLRNLQISVNHFLVSCIHEYQNQQSKFAWKHKIKKGIATIVRPQRMWKWVCKIAQLQGGKPRTYVDTIAMPDYAVKRNHLFKYEDVKETVYLPYEYTQVQLPVGYDNILTIHYGKYMELPPVEKRGLHHENLVFYDPNKPYTEYQGDEKVEKYFAGDNSFELL